MFKVSNVFIQECDLLKSTFDSHKDNIEVKNIGCKTHKMSKLYELPSDKSGKDSRFG